jgi:cytochrome c-type biogenesis protein CcmH
VSARRIPPAAVALLALLALLPAATPAQVGGPVDERFDASFEDPALAARYESLTRELRCLVCQNQTIADSHAPLATDLRHQVHRMLLDGASDEQIVAFMTDRYGDYVLYRPPFSWLTVLLWAGPFMLLALAAALSWRAMQRRAALATDEGTADGP